MKEKISIVIMVLITTSYSFTCEAKVTKLPPEYQQILRDVSAFHVSYSKSELPPTLLNLCLDSEGRMAEPGQKWEATDAIMDQTLPRKRLIWSASKDNLFVVHYEGGGIGHIYYFMVASMASDHSANIIWRGTGNKALQSYGEFVSALMTDAIDDRHDYGY